MKELKRKNLGYEKVLFFWFFWFFKSWPLEALTEEERKEPRL